MNTPYTFPDVVRGIQTFIFNLGTYERWYTLHDRVDCLTDRVNTMINTIDEQIEKRRRLRDAFVDFHHSVKRWIRHFRRLSPDWVQASVFNELADRVTALEGRHVRHTGGKTPKLSLPRKEDVPSGLTSDDHAELLKTITTLQADVARLAKHVNLPPPEYTEVDGIDVDVDVASLATETEPAADSD